MKLFRFLFTIAKPELSSQSRHLDKIVHLPVLAKEITEALCPCDGEYFLDMTFGGGGHTKHLLMTNKKITIFALDRDPDAFQRAIVLSKQVASKNNGQKVIPLLGRFSELPRLMDHLRVTPNFFAGAVMDLGASSFQYEEYQRGFSVKLDGPLDMRMDGIRFPNMPSASDVVNSLDADDLAKIFKVYGEEKHARKISQAIVDMRFMMKSFNTTRELAALISSIIVHNNFDKLGRQAHPATKIFQALRIFVNNELNELNYGIDIMHKYLKKSPNSHDDNETVTDKRVANGILAVISFHSLEDKIVKNHFVGHNLARTDQLDISDYNPLTNRSPINADQKYNKKWKLYKDKLFYPSENEVHLNPRSRSAKLRFGIGFE